MADGPAGRLVAGLPMYDWPEVAWATDALWRAMAARLRQAGFPAPARLRRDRPERDLWRDRGLILGQTCGYPYVSELRDVVRLVATPCYDAEGCDGPDYCSMIVVRGDDSATSLAEFDGQVGAINDPLSLSGCLALRAVLAGGGPALHRVVRSGGHRASLSMVADGRADICAVDAVCWALARDHLPSLVAGLRVLARSPAMPALPYVCAAGLPVAIVGTVAAALHDVLADASLASVREALLLGGAVALDDSAYDRVVALAGTVQPLPFADAG